MKQIQEVLQKTHGDWPEKILQFGGGNFLRGFADRMVEDLNDQGDYQGSIVICQPRKGGSEKQLRETKELYNVWLRGLHHGKPEEEIQPVTCISRVLDPYEEYEDFLKLAGSPSLEVVISNTTEAGIVYEKEPMPTTKVPESFPGKVAILLYERFIQLGALHTGLLFLPCELSPDNGPSLLQIVLRHGKDWALPEEFLRWVETENVFASTLVDRIVTGRPGPEEQKILEEKLGYRDPFGVIAEWYNLWVIQAPDSVREILPLEKSRGKILWTKDVTPYKQRKVWILNGAHTGTVPVAYLAGMDTVGEFMENPLFTRYLKKMLTKEIMPGISLPKEELREFAQAVLERFSNPYLHHKLLDIALNTSAKFQARCLPALLSYVKREGTLPGNLTVALGAYCFFYRVEKQPDGTYLGKRDKGTYPVRDKEEVLDFFARCFALPTWEETGEAILKNTALWNGEDLSLLPGMVERLGDLLRRMEEQGVSQVIEEENPEGDA